MTAEHAVFEELVALDALEALDPLERAKLEAHLATGCEACRQAMAESRALADELAHGFQPRTAPARIRRELLARVREDVASSPRPPTGSREHVEPDAPLRGGRGRWTGLALAASVLIAVGLGWYAQSLRTRLEVETTGRAALEEELQDLRETFGAFVGPSTRAVSLAGQQTLPGASAKAFLDPDNGRFFLYVYGLPELPPERTYQIWLIVSGQPVSVGTFDVGPNGDAQLDAAPLPSFDGAATVAVTEEPAGGLPQPTGDILLLGS